MGLVFGASIKDYSKTLLGRSDIWTLDNQPRKILITESPRSHHRWSLSHLDTIQDALLFECSQRKIVKEEQYKFQKGDILYGQNSKNTFIVLQNLGMTECNKIDFDDQGNVINHSKRSRIINVRTNKKTQIHREELHNFRQVVNHTVSGWPNRTNSIHGPDSIDCSV